GSSRIGNDDESGGNLGGDTESSWLSGVLGRLGSMLGLVLSESSEVEQPAWGVIDDGRPTRKAIGEAIINLSELQAACGLDTLDDAVAGLSAFTKCGGLEIKSFMHYKPIEQYSEATGTELFKIMNKLWHCLSAQLESAETVEISNEQLFEQADVDLRDLVIRELPFSVWQKARLKAAGDNQNSD